MPTGGAAADSAGSSRIALLPGSADRSRCVAARACSNCPPTSALRLLSRSMNCGWAGSGRRRRISPVRALPAGPQPVETHAHAADEHVAQKHAARQQQQPVPYLLAAAGLGRSWRNVFKLCSLSRQALFFGASLPSGTFGQVLVFDRSPGGPPFGCTAASCAEQRPRLGRAVAELGREGHGNARADRRHAAAGIDRHEVAARIAGREVCRRSGPARSARFPTGWGSSSPGRPRRRSW